MPAPSAPSWRRKWRATRRATGSPSFEFTDRVNPLPYTGTVAQSVAVQRAFGVYRGNKMNHVPLTFVRRARSEPWVRLEGYASAAEIARELSN